MASIVVILTVTKNGHAKLNKKRLQHNAITYKKRRGFSPRNLLKTIEKFNAMSARAGCKKISTERLYHLTKVIIR